MGTFDSVYLNKIRHLQEENLKLRKFIQSLNEMAVTQAGGTQQREIEDRHAARTDSLRQLRGGLIDRGSNRGEVEKGITASEELQNLHQHYHSLLQSHPTKIFDGSGAHVDTKSAPEGTTKADIDEHDADIHEVARRLDRAFDQYPKNMGRMAGAKPGTEEKYALSDEDRPHQGHVKAGKLAEKERIELRQPPRFPDDYHREPRGS